MRKFVNYGEFIMWLIIPLTFIILFCLFLNTPAGIGWIGECIIRFIIGKSKENQQYVLNNYMLLVDGKSSQIDHIVVNKHGVFVIETKNYSGRIYGNESQLEWTQTLNFGRIKNKLYNPLKQNATHIYRLKQLLPKGTPIKSIVVFVRNNVQYLSTDKVIGRNQLKAVINSPSDVELSTAEILSIYDALINARKHCTVTRTEHIKKIHEMKDAIELNICPRCGAKLQIRHGKNGDFYGCSQYPNCTFTKRL